jgi:ribonuclease PH
MMSIVKSEVGREVSIESGLSKQAHGSVIIYCGQTIVQCTATIQPGVPKFLQDQNQGWLTAEYSMLPAATHSRTQRESMRGKVSGRTNEIQRLIGRTLRAAIDLKALGAHTLMIDCDVLNADGSTRTAAITGGFVAALKALQYAQYKKMIQRDPLRFFMAATSVGLIDGALVVDIDYQQDSRAEADINIVMNDQGQLIEIQGTAERKPFSELALLKAIALAKTRCQYLIKRQKEALGAI